MTLDSASRRRTHILLFTSAFSTTNVPIGGHYYTTRTLAKMLAKHHAVTVAYLGDLHVQSLETIEGVKHLHGSFRTSPFLLLRMLRLAKSTHPAICIGVGHRFDAWVAQLTALLSRCKGVYVKPGGPVQSGRQLSGVDGYVVFHEDDLDYVNQLKPTGALCSVIPNRVEVVAKRTPRIDSLREVLAERGLSNRRILMRIGRIGRIYKSAIDAALEFGKRATAWTVVVIGHVQDSEMASELMASAPDNVIFLTNERWTEEARGFLWAADAVIGTGRGAIEAMSVGCPTFCMTSSGNTFAVNEATFHGFLRSNFSLRADESTLVQRPQNAKVVSLASIGDDTHLLKDLSLFTRKAFNEHLAADAGECKYQEFLANVEMQPKSHASWTATTFVGVRMFCLDARLYCLGCARRLRTLLSPGDS